MKQYRYIGSASHLAYTSVVLGALPVLTIIFMSIADSNANADLSQSQTVYLNQSQAVYALIMGGAVLVYFYKLIVSWKQDNRRYYLPQPYNAALLSTLLLSMGITGIFTILSLLMILMRVQYSSQAVTFLEYGATGLFLASLVCGLVALVKMNRLNRLYRRSNVN